MKVANSGTMLPNTSIAVTQKEETFTGFSEVLENLPGAQSYEQMAQFERQLSKVGELSGKQLIQYQITVSRFGLEVELTSKVAESGLSAIKRLQSNQ